MAYSIDYVPGAVLDEMRYSHQLGIFVRLESDPPLRIFFGDTDIPIGFDAVDPDGVVYLGGGRLIDIPSLEVLVNGTSDAVDFIMSGVDPVDGSRTMASLPQIRGKKFQVGLTTLDQYNQPMTKVVPIWTGLAARTIEQKPPVQSGEIASLTLALSVVGGENMRSRKSSSLWSRAQQVEVSKLLRAGTPSASLPDDEFCSQTGRLARGVAPTWPNYS